MAKFKKGDLLWCVEGPKCGAKGAGWKLGNIFSVKDLERVGNTYLYWPEPTGNGVYEDFLQLVEPEGTYTTSNIDPMITYGHMIDGVLRDVYRGNNNITEPTFMQKLTSSLKRLFNKDQQTLYKAGFINASGEPTQKAIAEINMLALETYQKELVALAEEELKDECND